MHGKKHVFIPLVLDEANKNTPKNRMMWPGISLVASSTIFPQMFFAQELNLPPRKVRPPK